MFMRLAKRILVVVISLVAFAWLVEQHYWFLEVDRCLDAGGVFDEKAAVCVGARDGVQRYFSPDASFAVWLVLCTTRTSSRLFISRGHWLKCR
jgi:hypothetical protein